MEPQIKNRFKFITFTNSSPLGKKKILSIIFNVSLPFCILFSTDKTIAIAIVTSFKMQKL